jgi:hypothetical protein
MIKGAIKCTKWMLDTAQKYTSWFMIGNSLLGGGGFNKSVSLVAETTFNKINYGNRLGFVGEFIKNLHWKELLETKGCFLTVLINGNNIYKQLTKLEGNYDLENKPFNFFKSVWLTGVGGLIELNTTETHLSLSVPVALLISGELTAESIALPLVAMVTVDSVLNMGEAIFVDSHPELSN